MSILSSLTSAFSGLASSITAVNSASKGSESALASFGNIASAGLAVAESFNGLVSAAKSLVEAYAPSSVLLMNLALRDLSAVIGSGLLPVVQTATGVFKDLGALLLPVMAQLNAAIGDAAKIFTSELTPVIEGLVQVFAALLPIVESANALAKDLAPTFISLTRTLTAVLMPIVAALGVAFELLALPLKLLAPLFEGMAIALETLVLIVNALVGAFTGFLGGLLPALSIKDGMDALRSAFRELAKITILAVASLAQLAGLTSVVDHLKKGLAPPERKSAEGFAAVTNAHTAGFEDLGKQLALAASVSAGKEGDAKKDDEADWRKSTLEALNKLGTSVTGVNQFIEDLSDAIAKKIRQAGKDAVYDATGVTAASNAIDSIKKKGITGYLRG